MKKMFAKIKEKFKERDEVKQQQRNLVRRKNGTLMLLVVLAIILIVLILLAIDRISIEKTNSISLNNLDKVLALEDDGKGGLVVGDEKKVGATFDSTTGIVTIYNTTAEKGTINRDLLVAFFESVGKDNIEQITFESEVYAPVYASELFMDLYYLTDINNANKLDTSNLIDMRAMFSGCDNLVNLDVSNWDVGKVQFLNDVFKNCGSLTNINVSEWNTSSVTNMWGTFEGCYSLTNLDVSNWSTGNVIYFARMFKNCSELQNLDVSNWDTHSVVEMELMFEGCCNLASLDVSNWKTGNVYNMWNVFHQCSSLVELNMSNWDMQNVQYFQGMFSECINLTTIGDISEWNTQNVIQLDQMFYKCEKLVNLDVTNWDTSNITNMQEAFFECNSLETLDVSKWNTSSVTNFGSTFYGCDNLINLDVSNWNVSNVTNFWGTFQGCSNLTNLDVSKWETTSATNFGRTFDGCSNLTNLDVSGWDVSNVTNFWGTFQSCSSLTNLDVSKWKTNNVTDFGAMFNGCRNLTNLDVSKFDVSKAWSLWAMFYNCSNLTELDVANWNVSNVQNLQETFACCSGIEVLDTSNWNASSATTMSLIFANCTNLKEINLSNCNTTNLQHAQAMFENCSTIHKINLRSWDVTNLLAYKDMFKNCKELYEIWTPEVIPLEMNSTGDSLQIETVGFIVLPADDYRDIDKIEERDIMYDKLTESTAGRHLFRGVFILFDVQKIVEYILPEYEKYIEPKTIIFETGYDPRIEHVRVEKIEEENPEETSEVTPEEIPEEVPEETPVEIPEDTTKENIFPEGLKTVWDEAWALEECGWEFTGWRLNTKDKDDVEVVNIVDTPYRSKNFANDVMYTPEFQTAIRSYKVNYLEKDTNEVIKEQKNGEDKEFGTVITSANEVIQIEGYNFDSVDVEELIIKANAEENVINLYYTKRNDLSYTVNYLEKGVDGAEDIVLAEAKVVEGQTYLSEVTEDAIDIVGYVKPEISSQTITIGIEENIINFYYTKRTDLSYTVNYLEKGVDGAEDIVLAEAKVIEGQTYEAEVTENAIDIVGYVKPEVTSQTIVIGKVDSTNVENNVINFYYTKRNDLSYTVNYLEKGVDGAEDTILAEAKVVEGQTYLSEVTEAAIDIVGYVKPEVASQTITIDVENNIINFYYTKRNDLTYKVNYLEKDTNKELSPQKVIENKTFEDVVTSSEEVIEIDGYNYDSVDKDTITITTGENVINIYYVKRNDLTYKVNYLEKATNKELSSQKVVENKTFEDVVTSSEEVIEIDGYNYDSVDKDELTITTGENIINIYYTKRNDLTYKVNYLEKDTDKVLNPQKVVENKTFEDVVTSSEEVIEIDGYNYDSVDKAELTITTSENVINIYYTKRNDLSYKVNYLEKDTNKRLHIQKIQNDMIFEAVVTSSNEVIDIDGYNYDSVDKAELTITTSENVINIYYTKRNDLSYEVNYLEKDTDKVLNPQKVQGDMTFETTVTASEEVIEIDGYNYNSVDKETLTITTGENVINIYYTKRNDLTYKVNYLEKDTNRVLNPQKIQENMTFEAVVTSSNEVIDIDGYNYNSVDKDELTITTGENVINIYYVKRNDLTYKVNYLEKDTNNILSTQKVQGNMTFEGVVTSSEEVIDIDGYNYDSVDKETLTITTGENLINIYYTKRNDLTYKVNYLEKDTNEVLNPQKVQENMTFEAVITSSNEVIDIDGYILDSVDKETLTITTGENIINIYYVKRSDLSYKVNYLEKDTNRVLKVTKEQDGMKFWQTVNASEEVEQIDGYNYDSSDKPILIITTGENVINLYYTKRNDLSYKVNYLEKDTNKMLSTQKVQGNMTFEEVVTSSEEVIDIDGYNYDSVDNDELTITTGENVINIYYTKRNDLTYKVNYLEKDTNEVLNPQKVKENMTFETVITSSNEVIDIDGYNYNSVDKDELTITTGENVINIYYTKRNDLTYKVNYLEKNTNKVIHEQKVKENMIFESVVTSSEEIIDIDGYNFDSVDKDTITITTGENIINIYYTKRNDLTYKVNYLEKDTDKVLQAQKVQNDMTFEYVVKAQDEVIDIDGYNYDSVDKDELTISTGENVINIYYTKRNDLSYKVNYLEKETEKVLHIQKIKTGMTFEEVVTSSEEVIDIDGYNYDSVDKDELTITTGENAINIYYTKRNDLTYKVNYLEKDTNKILNPQKVVENMTFEEVVTSSNEVIDIDGYNYNSVDKAELTITTGENVINIYYTKRNDLTYKVNYLEKDTDKVLKPQKVQENMTFEEVVTSSNEVIDIDGYNYNSVDKDELTITTGENVINIYYVKRNDLTYKVNYLEKDTDKVLKPQKIVENMTFEEVVTASEEVIELDGYNYDSVDKDELTITTGENVINIYYTKRNDLSYKVNYLEKDTNKILSTQKVQGNMTFEEVVTSSNEVIEIDGYNYNSVDKETLTITTGENIINIYYTKRNDLSYKVNYLEKDTNEELNPQKVQENMTFAEIVTTSEEVIDIDGYILDSVDKETLTITTGENVINIYYTKRNDLSYKVNYLEKGTNKALKVQKEKDGMRFLDTVNAEDEIIQIDGYNYDSNDKPVLVISTGENIINIYYTKRNDLTYKVNYLEKDTNVELSPQKVQNDMTFEDIVNAEDEVIEIDGYKYDSVDKETMTITTGENIINIYYTKDNDLGYKVNYLEKDTNKVLHQQKIQKGMTFEDIVNAEDEVIEIDGYNYDSVDKETIIITTGKNIINIYYVKRNDLSYKVNYLEKGTNKVLHAQKVQENMTFDDTVSAENEIIDINGYNYDSVDKETMTITTGENVINIYYTKRNDLTYKVNYLEKDTDKALHPQKVQENMTFEAVVTSSNEVINIDGYNFDSLDKETITITTGENVINIYYTKRNDLTYKVNYLEKDTNEVLNPQKVVENMTFEEVVTTSEEVIEIDGYILDSVDKETLKITTGENIINIYYVKRSDLSYKVNYLEKDTNNVLKVQKEQDGMKFLQTVNALDEVIQIDGYNYDSSDKTILIMTTGENVINLYYTKRNDLSYKVNYLEKDTNKVLHNQKVQGNMTFEEVVTSSEEVIDIDGYNFDSVDKAELAITTSENVINIYYVKRNDLTYKVNYLEKDTGKVLHAQKVQENMTFEAVVTSSNEIIDIDGYNYNSVDKESLIITTGENVINIYYTKRHDLTYKVNYLEKDTNKVLQPQKVQNDMTFEEVVTSSEEVIDIDGYNYDSVDKEQLTITTGENVINIYYVKRNDLIYKVNYLEKDTNKVLQPQKVQENMTFEDIVNAEEEIIEIDGYNYDSLDKETLTITTGENVINIYYTKRNDLTYKVNYLEKDTDKVLQPQRIQENMTFEDVVISEDEVIEIDGYNYDSVDKETITITTGENIINIYYTKRNDLTYKVNYLEKDTNKVLQPQKIQENMTFEDIVNTEDEVIDIDGYNYDSVDKETITITTGENVINIYYTKRNDLSYTVNYLEKDTNKVLKDQKVVDNVTFETIISASDEVVNIYGYNFDSANIDELVISTKDNVINLYYIEKVTSVIVHHYVEGTEKQVAEDVIIEGKVNSEYETTIAEDLPSKYELVGIPSNATGTMTEDTIEVIYYYKLKSTKVIVHHYEEGTTNKLSEDVEIVGLIDSTYITEVATDIPIKYTLVEKPVNAAGVMMEDVIEVTYYYAVKDAILNIYYLEKDTDIELAKPEQQTGKVEEYYRTDAKEIEGYTLVENSGNTTGQLEVEPLTVTYYYLKNTRATVQYIDSTNDEILEERTEEGLVGDEFITEAKVFEDYILIREPEHKTVNMAKDEIVLRYYYVHVSGGIIEQHIDLISGDILYNEAHEGNEGDEYNIEAKEFKGYDLVEDRLPVNSEGTMTIDPITVTYYYIYKTQVTTKYIDKTTGERIDEDVIQEIYEDDMYTTEVKEIEGYKLIQIPEDSNGKTTKDEVLVIYYYVPESAGVIERHVDDYTNEEIIEPRIYSGYAEDNYETDAIQIQGYDLVKEKYPTNNKGKMTKEEIVVTYYYSKRTQVQVKYVDKATGEEIFEREVIYGHRGDDYTTEEKEIPGYDLVQVPVNKDETMIDDTTEVIYYYARPAKVITNYYDIDTKETLAAEEVIEGHESDEYRTIQKEIKYYKLVELPKNSKGIMTAEDTIVNYYYTKKTFNLKIEKRVKQVAYNGQVLSINNDIGKLEIDKNDVSATEVVVTYEIKVINTSDLAGKAEIVENIPNGMIMTGVENENWNINTDTNTATLITDNIAPKQERSYEVVMRWNLAGDNLGMKENIAEIVKTENEAGFEEMSLGDDKGKADLVISIKTGAEDNNTIVKLAILAIFAILGITVTVIIKKEKNK